MSLVITIALLGLLASVSPSTIVVFILLLTTARACVNAARLLDRVERLADHRVRRELCGRGSPRHPARRRQRRGGGHRDPARCRPGRCCRAAMETPGSAQDRLTGRQEVHGPPEAAQSVGSSHCRGPGAAVDRDRRRRRGFSPSFPISFPSSFPSSHPPPYPYYRLVQAGPAVFAIGSVAVGVFLIIDGVTGIVGS